MESILTLLELSANKYNTKTAFTIRRKIKKNEYTYTELIELVYKFDTYFTQTNIQQNTKILIWGLNCPEYSTVLLAIFALNRCAIPIDYKTSEETLSKIIDLTKPQVAFISKYFKSEIISSKKIDVIYIEDIFRQLNTIPISNPTLLQTALNDYKNPENIVEIVYTSGTTGTPKGVIIKQKNLVHNLNALEQRLQNMKSDITISLLPLSHMFEQIVGLLLPMVRGITIVYLPRIDSSRMLSAFDEYKPTHLIFVPQLLKIIWQKIEEKAIAQNNLQTLHKVLNLSAHLPFWTRKLLFRQIHKLFGGKLKYIACGGAPLEANLAKNFINLGIKIIEGYGATEATAVATINDLVKPLPGSVGKPLPGTTITISDNSEILIKSGAISDGYFNDVEKTSKSFGTYGYKTGDIGTINSKGQLFIKGRDTFKIVLPSGEKVFVEDLESKITNDPNIKEVCVVGIKIPGGDKIHVYIIPKNKQLFDLKETIKHINTNLESKQQITSYNLWQDEDFPRTSTLKINRKAVYEKANQIHSQQLATKNQFIHQDILDILSYLSSRPKHTLDTHLSLTMDLKMDSLTRTELVSLAEDELGIVLNEEEVNQYTTVGDLLQICERKSNTNKTKPTLPTWMFTQWGHFIHRVFLQLILIPIHSYVINIKYVNIPEIQPGSIVIVNHPGIADIVCTLRLLHTAKIYHFVVNAWEGIWTSKSSLAKLVETGLCGIPLYKEGKGFVESMKLNSDLVDSGYCLIVAPQGTMQREDNEDAFLEGIGFIIKELQRPVYMLKIKNYRQIWPAKKGEWATWKLKDFLPKKRGTVTITTTRINYENIDYTKMSNAALTSWLEDQYKHL